MSVKKQVYEFCSETSAHGFGKVSSSQGPRRFLWVLITSAALAGFTFHLSELTKNYLSYTKSVNNDVVKNGFRFPAVTFCPTHAFSGVKIRKFINQKDISQIKQFWKLAKELQTGNTTTSDEVLNRGSLKTLVYKYDLFKHPQDHIVSCTFQDQECDFRNFTLYKHNKWISCLRFSPDNNIVRQKGPQDGLKLVLNTYGSVRFDKMQKEDLLDSVDGYVIRIHAPRTRASFTSGRILAERASLLNVGMNMKLVENLNTPMDPCDDRFSNWTIVLNIATGPPHESVTFHNKTDADCSVLLEQNEMIKRCGCLDENSIIEKTMVENLTYCHQIDPDLLSVMTNTTSLGDLSETQIERIIQRLNFSECNAAEYRSVQYELDNYACKKDNCRSISYSTATQSTKWPADNEQDITDGFLIKKLRHVIRTANELGVPLDPSTLDYVFRNLTVVNGLKENGDYTKFPFIAINIFANSLSLMQEKEALSVTFPEFIANIGGIMGLWIGISAITLCEFTDLFLSIVGFLCCRFRSSHTTKKVEEDVIEMS